MGMYTELKVDLVLQGVSEQDLELFDWLQDPYKSVESFDYKVYPVKYKDSEFFSCGRKSWFTGLSLSEVEDNLFTLKGGAELKNYESQIENLYEMIEHLVLHGSYKSLYEEHDNYFEHTEGVYENGMACHSTDSLGWF